MLTTIAKRVQTRLSKQGVKVTLGEIRPVVKSMVTDINNPSADEVNQVTEYFINNATKLVVIQEDVTTELDTTNEETSICVGGENGNIAEPTQTELETLPQNSLATATKSELVFTTATSLGITLNTSEIELIASNVNKSSDDLTDSLDEIKGAIIAFVRHKIALNSQKIGETLEEITQVATDGFNQNSQQLTDGLQNINKQLQQQSTDFKSKVRSTLKCFQLPAAS